MTTRPTHDQFAALIADSERLDGEVVMLNLLKFKDRASSAGGGTGEESYQRYGELATRMVTERGGRIAWMGRPDAVVIGDEAAGDWDVVILVAYPSRKVFLEMIADPDYESGNADREGGVERMALVAMTPDPGFGVTGS